MASQIGEARDVTHIVPLDLMDFEQALRSRKPPLAISTFNKYCRIVGAFWNWLVNVKGIESSPVVHDIMRQQRVERAIDRDKAMPEEHLALLLRATEFIPRDHALICFIADTGCRAGGVASLTLERLHLEEQWALLIEKGDKERKTFFAERTATALERWLLHRPQVAHDHVFTKSRRYACEPMTATAVSAVIRSTCRRVGVPERGAHSLRHRKGFQLADHRIPPSVASAAMGHADVTTTLRHYFPYDEERVAAALNELALTDREPSSRQKHAEKIIPLRKPS
jgi:integrase